MSGRPLGKADPSRASRKRAGTREATSVGHGAEATTPRTRDRAKATLVSLGLRSPWRPTIERTPDELLTRQRLNEEALLVAIEGALGRNDGASLEGLRLQLKEQQQRSLALREGLALENSARMEPGARAEQLQACQSKIKEELEAVRVLAEELQAAKEFVEALEARIAASVTRAENFAKELDALPKLPSLENMVRRNVEGAGVTQGLRSQESSAVGMNLAIVPRHQRNSLQRLIDQEKQVTPRIDHSTSPRGNVEPPEEKSHRSIKKDRSHRSIEKLKSQRQTIDLSSVKSATRKKRADEEKGDEAYVVPASPLSPGKRFTLQTFGEWSGSQRGTSRAQGWQEASVHSPRQSNQLATPRLGVVRKDVSDAITKLVGSMDKATKKQLEEAVKTLEGIEGSRQNLGAAIQDLMQKAAAARRQSRELEEHADDMEAQAATLQKVNEGGTPRGQETIAALRAELARRASRQTQDSDAESVEYGSVEEIEKQTEFGLASLSLDDVLNELEKSVAKPIPQVSKKHFDAAPQPLLGTSKSNANKKDRANAKLDAHLARRDQFKRLIEEEEKAVQKWQARTSQEPEVVAADGVSNL